MRGPGLILLAAGASRRMGAPKQLLCLGGETLVRRAAATALGSACRPVVVVLGAHAARVRRELRDLPVRIAANREWKEGIGSSVRAGLTALLAANDTPCDAVVITLCDQPLVTPALLDRLVEAHRRTRCPIAAADYGKTLGVPALFHCLFFPLLPSLRGDAGARQVLRDYRDHVAAVPSPAASRTWTRPRI